MAILSRPGSRYALASAAGQRSRATGPGASSRVQRTDPRSLRLVRHAGGTPLRAVLLLVAVVACFSSQAAGSRPVSTSQLQHAGKHTRMGHMLSKLRRAVGQGTSGPVLSHDTQFQLAKMQQDDFCRMYYPLDLNNTHLVTMDGFQITVYAEGDIVSTAFNHGQQWDAPHVQEVLWALNAPLPDNAPPAAKNAAPVFLDIGANLGAFSLPVAAQGYQVLAVEGMPKNQVMLRQSICASGLTENITLYALALGAERSMCYLMSDDRNVGDGVMVCGVDSPEAALPKNCSIAYRVRNHVMLHTLDTVVQRDIKVMKIDVESHEPAVFKGAQRLMHEPNVWFILVEHEPSSPERWMLLQDLDRWGYQLSVKSFQGPFMTIGELEGYFKENPALCDVFCVRTRW